jgi:periplasmic divalent cation tolerance protein
MASSLAQYNLIYCPCSNATEAEAIATTLVTEGLVACGNIINGGKSVYMWEGKVETSDEVYLILKTRKELFEVAKARIESIHSYSVPCILSLPIENGNSPFLRWIDTQTIEKK